MFVYVVVVALWSAVSWLRVYGVHVNSAWLGWVLQHGVVVVSGVGVCVFAGECVRRRHCQQKKDTYGRKGAHGRTLKPGPMPTT
jgi:hypothetical protein